jgi:hypothetical protein
VPKIRFSAFSILTDFDKDAFEGLAPEQRSGNKVWDPILSAPKERCGHAIDQKTQQNSSLEKLESALRSCCLLQDLVRLDEIGIALDVVSCLMEIMSEIE